MKKRILNLVLIIITLFLILLLSLYILKTISFKCFFKELFNIYCAGCGTTRMIQSFLSLNFYQAFRYNPFIFILCIVLIPYITYDIYLYIKKGKIILPSLRIIIIILSLCFIYMILRNIPGFEYLLPTKIS